MKRDLSEALDEGLSLLKAGEVTLEECLARYPEYAADLRPLLEVALQVSGATSPIASPAAYAAGKQRMLDALAEKKRREAISSKPLLRPAERVFAHLARLKHPTVPRGISPLQLAAAAGLLLVVVLVGMVLLSWLRPGTANAATVTKLNGAVEVLPAGSDFWETASPGGPLDTGDRIRTGAGSAATVSFYDESATKLEANTEVTVAQMSFRRDGGSTIVVLHQTSGETYSRVQRLPDQDSRFEIETPTAVAVVRGTEFALSVGNDGTTRVAVLEGVVHVTAQEFSVAVPAGQETLVQPERPPGPSRPILAIPATKTRSPIPTAADSPAQDRAKEPPGQTKTPQPPGHSKTAKPPPGAEKTQPPGQDKAKEPPGKTKTPQPPGQTKAPKHPDKSNRPQPPGHHKRP